MKSHTTNAARMLCTTETLFPLFWGMKHIWMKETTGTNTFLPPQGLNQQILKLFTGPDRTGHKSLLKAFLPAFDAYLRKNFNCISSKRWSHVPFITQDVSFWNLLSLQLKYSKNFWVAFHVNLVKSLQSVRDEPFPITFTLQVLTLLALLSLSLYLFAWAQRFTSSANTPVGGYLILTSCMTLDWPLTSKRLIWTGYTHANWDHLYG